MAVCHSFDMTGEHCQGEGAATYECIEAADNVANSVAKALPIAVFLLVGVTPIGSPMLVSFIQ